MLQVRTLAALWLSSALLIAAGLALGMQALSGHDIGPGYTPIETPAPSTDDIHREMTSVDLDGWLREDRDARALSC